MKIKHYLLSIIFILSIFSVYAQNVEPFVPARYTDRLKGDILMIGNNVLSAHPSNEYNTQGNPSTSNDATNMVYVDIDGDASTFSSSSAIMQVPNTSRDCYKIVYAALYWSGTYRTGDRSQLNQIRFRTPGAASYTNVTGSIVYDEGASNLLTNDCLPYVAFADVTSLINPTNAEGNYTVANVRASQGDNDIDNDNVADCPGGNAAGWNLFLIYSDPKLPGKYIATFDGFSGIRNGESLVIPLSGFQTNPAGNVNAKLAFAALEGDNKLSGDGMQIRGTTPALPVIGFSNVTAPSRTTTNFFNSSISDVSGNSSGRTPNSQNTLGFDAGITDIANPARSVLRNNETNAEVRIYTDQDQYYLYFLAFSVEIIEPEVLMTKSVQNLAGQDIGNQNVTLCQELNYVIGFDNIGNDDAEGPTGQALPPGGVGSGTDYVLIRDVLPINTTLVSIDTSNVPGTIVVNSPAGTLNMYVPKQYLTARETRHFITIRVRIACSCAELTTACSNLIVNQAFITYQGVISDIVITNDPSSSTYNLACLSGNADSTNFLVGLDTCTFNTDVFICGNSVTLTAGAGYDNYVWTGPVGAIFTPNNTSQTVSVNMPGLYTVNGTDALCRPIRQTFNVIQYGASLTNPIIPYDESPVPVICSDNGERLPYIFLCGSTDSQLLQTNITNTTSVEWFKYNESLAGCGPYPPTNCPVTTDACWTNLVGTGSNYTVTQAGFYRVVFTFPGGCNRTFYFNAYQNLLDPIAVPRNIICGSSGSITVNNVPTTGYEFQLLNSSNVVVFPWQSSNVFTPINTAGVYTVQVRPTAFSGGCVFSIPNVAIQSLTASVTANVTQPLCFGEFGSVNIGITGVPGQYYYVLHQGPTVASPIVGSVGPTSTTFNIFTNLTAGQTYTWEVWTDATAPSPVRGCYTTGTFTLNNPSQLMVTSSITRPYTTCGDGEITVNTTGGTPPYYYYLNNTPPSPFIANGVSSVVIPVNAAGTYTITVYDANNCIGTTQQVITQVLAPVFSMSHTDIICASAPNAGSITFNVTNSNGNTLLYSINGGTTWQTSPVFTNLPAGTYNTQIQFTVGTAVCTTAIQQIIIDPANPLSATASMTTNYTCTGGTGTVGNAVITASPTSNGAGGLQYSIDGGITWQASPIFSNLGAGTYTIIVRDINGCTFTIPAVIITPLTPPTDLNFTATPLTCPTNVSTVTVTATGGAPTLTYAITAPAAAVTSNVTGIFSNLAPGTYTFQVTDGRNCTYSETYTINPLAAFNVTPTVVSNVVCFGTSTGVIRFTVAGYSPTYNYTVTGPGGYTQSATGVSLSTITLPAGPAGTYTITVTNPVTNCQDIERIDILGPTAALTATLVPTEVTCTSLGTLTVNASNGWGGYVYTIAPSAGITLAGNVFSNIPASATPYVVTITDANGCSITRSYTFNAPTIPILTLSATSDFCFDSGNQATLVVTASNGIAPYSFSLNGGAYVLSNTPINSHTFSNLTPGTYTVSVRDAFGCTNNVVFSQTINPQLTVNTVLTKDFDCTASSNAIITGTISGGYPGYTYAVSYNGGGFVNLGAVTGSTFTYNVPTVNSGTYVFQITDSRGCTVLSSVTTINALSIPVLTVTPASQNLKCFGDSTGSITWSVAGGNPTFTIQVVNTTTGVNYGTQTSGLPAGNYTVTVTDSRSCTDNENFVINQPAQIFYTTTVNPITCNIASSTYNPGSICINTDLVGGTLPITFTLTNSAGVQVGAPIVVGSLPLASQICFPSVDFGVYTVTAVDGNGCTRVVPNLIMSSPPSGLTFTFVGASTCAGGASLQVNISGGVIGPGTYQFGIVDLTAAPWSSTLVNSNNGPASHIFTGLIPGATYTIVVYDTTTGCYHFQTAPTVPTSINPTLTRVINNVTCRGAADGNIQFALSGLSAGLTQFSYQLIDAATNLNIGGPVLINAPFTFPYTISPLAPGSYNILIRETAGGANVGCGKTFGPFVISESATALNLSASSTPDNCNTNAGVITAVASGGTGPYLYQLFNDTGVVGVIDGADPITTNPVFSASFVSPTHIPNVFNRESGDYIVYAKDANGCIKEFFITITLDPTPVVAATIANACATQGNFAINVTLPTVGIAPHTYSIDGGAYQVLVAPFTISGLSSGPHSVQVRDKNGCGNRVDLTILAPLSASASFTTQPTCNTANGTITVTASGGTGSYTYTLGATTNVTGIFPGLAPGTYTITVTDVNMQLPAGCSTTATVVLASAVVPSFTLAQTGVKCAGDANGSITVTLLAGNNDVPYRYRISAGPVTRPFQNSNVFTNLPTGFYTIEVESGRGCLNTDTITVTTPLALTGTATFPALYSCTNNVIDPVIVTVNETPGTGTGPYTYSINGGGYFTTNTFPIVASTTSTTPFTFSIKDANGCIYTDNTSFIPQLSVLTASVIRNQQITCLVNEIVTINASGGSGNYSYVSLPQPGGATNVVAGPGANQFTISAPGTYYFRVIDNSTNCWVDTTAYLIPVFNTIQATAASVKPVTCFNGADGLISLTVTGYTGNYSYQILDSLGNPVAGGSGTANTASGTIQIPVLPSTGLPAGTYTVSVTETDLTSPRCSVISTSATVQSPSAALALIANETANVTCDNNKGVIVATASGGWGNYTYTISPNNGTQTSPGVFEGLSGTTNYTITVRDAQNCQQTANVTLTRPNSISLLAPIANIQLTCFGVNDGMVDLTGLVTGGQNVPANYNYTLNYINPTGTSSGPQQSPIFTNLGPGQYSITINDPYNCIFTTNVFTVLPANQVFATLSKVANSQVCDTSFETLTLAATGGTGSYEYSTSATGPWTAFVSPLNLGSLAPNTYTYYVRDTNHCAAVASNGVTINVVPTLGLNPIADIQLDCSYFNTTITAQAFGGEGGYSYSIVPNLPTIQQLQPGVFTNVPIGSYTITVNSGDCTSVSRNVNVTSPLPFTYSIQAFNTSCSYTNDGSVIVTLSGVDGRQVQYSLQSSDGIYTHSQTFDVVDETQPTFTINNLAGNVNYEISVFTIPSGCTPGPLTFRIGRPAAINATINVTNELCSEDNEGELIITNITGGTNVPSSTAPIYTVSYTSTSTVTPSGSITLPLGTNFHTFTGLDGGDYVITIKDTNNCEFTFNKTILPGDDYEPAVLVTYPCNPVTNTPMVKIEIINKSTPKGNFGAGYVFQLDSFPLQTSPVFLSTNPIYTAALSTPGNHTYSVLGPNDCYKPKPPFNSFTVDPKIPLYVYLVVPPPVINTATAMAFYGSGNYTYTFYADGQLVQSGSSNTYIYTRQYAKIKVVVTDDSGCTDEDEQYLPYLPICIPEILTPDGNGQNDDWGPGCVDPTIYPRLVTKIYDRYGRLIATLPVGARWNGQYEGKALPSGDYWYVIKVDNSDGQELVGHFTLYR